MATLKDIADAVRLNKTTVSKALRGASDISLATRERVLEAARELGYRPRPRRGTPLRQAVGLICPELTSHFYGELISVIDRRLRSRGYTPHILISSFSGQAEESDLRMLARTDMAGAICLTERCDGCQALAHAFGALSGPVVVLGAEDPSADHDVICVDERSGIEGAVEKMRALGHRRIAFIGEPLARGRMETFLAVSGHPDPPVPEALVQMRPERNEEGGYRAMRALLDLPEVERPTAVLAAYDRMALGAYRAAAEAGLDVPAKLSLAGFDDAAFCSWLPVSLSSVSSGGEEIGGLAVDLLMKRLEQPENALRQTVTVHTRFIARESLGRAP